MDFFHQPYVVWVFGRYLQHGTFDAKSGEYEYIWRPDSQAPLGRSHPSISNVGAAFVVIFVGFTVKTTHIISGLFHESHGSMKCSILERCQ